MCSQHFLLLQILTVWQQAQERVSTWRQQDLLAQASSFPLLSLALLCSTQPPTLPMAKEGEFEDHRVSQWTHNRSWETRSSTALPVFCWSTRCTSDRISTSPSASASFCSIYGKLPWTLHQSYVSIVFVQNKYAQKGKQGSDISGE